MKTTLHNLQTQLKEYGLSSFIVELIVNNTVGSTSIEDINDAEARRLQAVLTDYVELAAKCENRTSGSNQGQSPRLGRCRREIDRMDIVPQL